MKEIEHNGFIYYIGKDKHDNDKMFDKMANDMTWFHLEEYSSAHVYVKVPRGESKHKVIKHAAYLVRQSSKAHGFQKVCYVKKMYLTKCNGGGAPGELEFDPEHMKIV